MSDLSDLYQEVILDHNRHPRNFGQLPDATRTAKGYNPLCGDRPFSVPEGHNVDALTAPVPSASDAPEMGPLDAARTAELQPKIVAAVKTVYDPEIPVDIY